MSFSKKDLLSLIRIPPARQRGALWLPHPPQSFGLAPPRHPQRVDIGPCARGFDNKHSPIASWMSWQGFVKVVWKLRIPAKMSSTTRNMLECLWNYPWVVHEFVHHKLVPLRLSTSKKEPQTVECPALKRSYCATGSLIKHIKVQ